MTKSVSTLVFRITLGVLLLVLVVALFRLQVVKGAYYQRIAESNFVRIRRVTATRGEIYDVKYRPIVINIPSHDLYLISGKVENIDAAGGYDHNFVLNHRQGDVERIATVVDPAGGIAMDVYTDQPGVQLFTPPDFTGMTGKGGAQYGPRPAFCLETQHFASAMDFSHFPSIILHAGEIFSSETPQPRLEHW